MSFEVLALGQVGYRITAGNTTVVIDPYLGDSVAESFGDHLKRLVPAPAVEELRGVQWVLLTHAHLDHTDPASIRALLAVAPAVQFLAPYESDAILAEMGIPAERRRLVRGDEEPITLGDISLRVVPAAHTLIETNAEGAQRYVGYLLWHDSVTLYHAGDTIPHPLIIEALQGESIDHAFLPVNERNFYRDREGIVGNMSVREAFAFCAQLGARSLIPTHWDLFAPNRTHLWEFVQLHAAEHPPFELTLIPCGTSRKL